MVGMTAALEIIIHEKPDALMVPISAVKDEQGKRYVVRKKSGASADPGEKVEVTTGYTTQDNVEIVKGIKAGDIIAAGGEPPGIVVPSGSDSGASGKKQ
jgi:HlyD family secretion protein